MLPKHIKNKTRTIFKSLGVWPTTYVLSYFSNVDIIETLRRVNKEAWFACKKAYSARGVLLHKISLKSVKFFERAEEITINKDSLDFF
jgi:hypothetical protein